MREKLNHVNIVVKLVGVMEKEVNEEISFAVHMKWGARFSK